MANKVTKREVINSMLANEVIASNEMYVAYLQNELKLLDKKAEKKGKSAEELAEVERLKGANKKLINLWNLTNKKLWVNKESVRQLRKLSKEILERLSKYNEISIITFVANDLLVPKLFSFTDVFTWDYLMESLIDEGKIKVIREEKQEDSIFDINTRIISIVN